MSLRNITTGDKNNDVFVNTINCVNCDTDILDCKTMGCDEVFATNLYTRNDDNSITRLNQPNNGGNGQFLKSNGDGTVVWSDASNNETYTTLSHTNLQYKAGTGGSSTGFSTNTDRQFICSKNGNFRHISGEIDVKIDLVNGYSIFSLSFDAPYNEFAISRTYGTCIGYSSNNAWLFNAISVSSQSSGGQNRIGMTLQTVNRQNWTQTTTLIVRVMYNLSYLVPA